MGPDAMILVFRMLSFKPTFSLSFTFIKRLFSSSLLSAIRVVSSAYLRLLIFLPVTLIPVCASSSPAAAGTLTKPCLNFLSVHWSISMDWRRSRTLIGITTSFLCSSSLVKHAGGLLLFWVSGLLSTPLSVLVIPQTFWGFLGGPVVKYLQCRRYRFDPWVGKIPWSRKWQPTPVFLPGESHGQRSLVGYSPWGCKE